MAAVLGLIVSRVVIGVFVLSGRPHRSSNRISADYGNWPRWMRC